MNFFALSWNQVDAVLDSWLRCRRMDSVAASGDIPQMTGSCQPALRDGPSMYELLWCVDTDDAT